MAQHQSEVVEQSPPTLLLTILERPEKYTCMNCKIKFESAESQRAHFKTEWHLYNLKRKVCNLESIDRVSFDKIQEMTPAASVDDDSDYDIRPRTRRDSSFKDQPIEEDLITIESDLDSNWEEIDDNELLDEDYEDSETVELLAKIVPIDTCLFCGKKSSSFKSNINHMESDHGFFIPEEQYLIDQEGLIEYLGFKVGAGATCLWCNKQFAALHGVRLHMLYKDHCKIRYDQDSAIEEFKSFYDYSNQVQLPMKPLSELMIPKKQRPDRHNERSLVATDQPELSKQSKQLLKRQNPAIVAGTYQSKSIKKFNAQRAKRLLEIALANNGAIRGRLRRQNPM